MSNNICDLPLSHLRRLLCSQARFDCGLNAYLYDLPYLNACRRVVLNLFFSCQSDLTVPVNSYPCSSILKHLSK